MNMERTTLSDRYIDGKIIYAIFQQLYCYTVFVAQLPAVRIRQGLSSHGECDPSTLCQHRMSHGCLNLGMKVCFPVVRKNLLK